MFSQVCVCSTFGGGVPHPRSGWGGVYPIPGLPGVPPSPRPGMGYPPALDLGWGIPPPWTWDGVPRPDLTWGTPPDLTWGTPPPRRISIASTCYAAGGMPLAFTQEDFLVYNVPLLCNHRGGGGIDSAISSFYLLVLATHRRDHFWRCSGRRFLLDVVLCYWRCVQWKNPSSSVRLETIHHLLPPHYQSESSPLLPIWFEVLCCTDKI